MLASDPKRYAFDKPNGQPSAPFGLKAVMAAAERNLKVGDGAFVVTRGGQYHHPGLNRAAAITVARECLRSIPLKSGITIRDAAGKVVFHAVRVATNPYADPFRDAKISAERIDAGVDYYVDGPIYALGNAIVTNVGKPSGTSVFSSDMPVYQLLDGPFAEKYVYNDEHLTIAPGIRAGMRVDSNTVLYHGYASIECGWSDGHGSMAWDLDGDIEGQRTAWGQSFSDLLESTGCIPGLTLGRPITMTLPKGWPTAA